MRVHSNIMCGVSRNGRVLLQKGENVLEEPLSSTERAFVKAMVAAKVVKVLEDEVPEAPISETKIKAGAPAKKRAAKISAPKKPMRTRRAAAK